MKNDNKTNLRQSKKSFNEITIIAAADENDALGRDNKLIWHIKEDLKRFQKLTSGHAIIMGRKTFESMPRALPNRRNIVVTRNPNYIAQGAETCSSIEKASDTGIILIPLITSLSNSEISLKFSWGIRTFLIPALIAA